MREMSAEMRANPVLAASLGPDCNEEFKEGPGERAVREIRQQRRLRGYGKCSHYIVLVGAIVAV